jgi:hypothetical protein
MPGWAAAARTSRSNSREMRIELAELLRIADAELRPDAGRWYVTELANLLCSHRAN